MSDDPSPLLQGASPGASSNDLHPVQSQDPSKARDISSDGVDTNVSIAQAQKNSQDVSDREQPELEQDYEAELAEQLATRKHLSAFKGPRPWW